MLMAREETKPHVLIVEDARDIREPLGRYLREHGYRATTAADALAARKMMKGAAIDLVVLDIMMPGEDGLSLCRSIRETSQIPVILLTARGEAALGAPARPVRHARRLDPAKRQRNIGHSARD